MDATKLDSIYTPLRVTFGLVPVLAGLDKFFGLLVDWQRYLSPAVTRVVPASVFMPIVGVVEIAVGLMILTRWPRAGAYVAMAWLCAISLNLLLVGAFDVAVRDLVMAVGAYTLARLSELRRDALATV